jgi:hypothetical protein
MKKQHVEPALGINRVGGANQREENGCQMDSQTGTNSSSIVAKPLSPRHSIGKMAALASTDGITTDIPLAIAWESLEYLSSRFKRDGRQKSSLDAGWL